MFLFLSARLRLTMWFVLIASVITFSFSALIYQNVADELERGYKIAESRFRGPFVPGQPFKSIFESELGEAKKLLLVKLLGINGIILAGTAVAGFFLASKTLRPIEVIMDEQKRFVSDASHELRTPLTSLKSEIEVALLDPNLDVKESRALLKSNLEEVNKMQNLTNYLLALTKYENRDIKLSKEPIQLNELVPEVIKKYEKKAAKAKITLSLSQKPTKVNANATSIEELLSILLDNAIKYTPSGGLVSVKISPKKSNAVIEVRDTGIGIGEDEIDHIFDRFYRADRARTKSNTEGYGLGLSIAQSIVNMHGGHIKVKSAITKGTTFTVILPS